MRKFMTAAISAVTAAAMLVPTAAFAEETTEAESVVTEPTKITFIFADGDEGFKQTMNTLVGEFNDKYPDITIEVQPGNGGSYSEFLKTKDSVGEFPDLMEQRDTAMYVRAGKLLELPERAEDLAYFTAPGGNHLPGEQYDGV